MKKILFLALSLLLGLNPVAVTAAESEDPDVLGFQSVKIGPFDATLFECELTGKTGEKLLWHNWAFMDGNKCYFVLSAYPKDMHDKIFPDVEKMLKTFKIK